MGKTKTAFVEVKEEVKKTSLDELKEKRERQAAATKAKKAKEIHISGLKGGQRIKIIEAMPAEALAKAGEPSFAKASKGHREPRVHSKKYNEVKAKVDRNKSYTPKEAIKLVKETSYTKFNGSVELHMATKKTGLSVQVSLPHSAGKEKRVEVASEETLKKIQGNKIDFDILVATPEMMPKLVPFARILGPKGLMPNPKNGTLVPDIKKAKQVGGNTITIKTEKEAPLIHTVIGKVSQKEEEPEENLAAIIKAVSKKQIEKAYLKATMGPSIRLKV